MADHLKFVIVGHVDHGKSTLIGRLFYDTDSLPPDKKAELEKSSKDLGRDIEFSFVMDHLQEEREQGITIDTAQTFFKTEKREYVIIDAPGHVEFVKNMITGASQAEAGLVMIDAEEGIQEQTKRHSYILNMLGLDQVVVVINKMDLVDYSEERYEQLKKEMTAFLKDLGLATEYYIPISAQKGDNVANASEKMSWYKGPTVLSALDSFTNKLPSEKLPLLLPVQDIYKIDDGSSFKRIIVGRVETGEIKKDQEIVVLPDGKKTKVASIERYMDENPEYYLAGESAGFTTTDPVSFYRGNVVCEPGNEPVLTDTFQANIFWLSKKELHGHEKLTIRCATQEYPCRIKEIHQKFNSSSLALIGEASKTLQLYEVGVVTLKTKKPVAITPFGTIPELGRFVLMRNESVCAGGIIKEIPGS